MFLPYETTLSLWLRPSAVYDWEPEPPLVEPARNPADAQVAESAQTAGDAGGAASCTPTGLPVMRLVFKGIKWTTYPVFGTRENIAWEQGPQTRREVDEAQRADKLRESRKTRPPVPPKPRSAE
jgi:hypothetical protein